MGILKNFKNFGTYKAFCKCPNCGYGSEIKITKGISVADFVKDGKCLCDNCRVVFFPDEYTTGHFEKDKKKDMNIKLIKTPKFKVSESHKNKPKMKIKW